MAELCVFFGNLAAAAAGAAEVGAVGVGFVVFLAPEAQLLFFGADYAALAQLFVVGYFAVGKLAVFAEYDVEAQSEHAKGHQGYRQQKGLHSATDI